MCCSKDDCKEEAIKATKERLNASLQRLLASNGRGGHAIRAGPNNAQESQIHPLGKSLSLTVPPPSKPLNSSSSKEDSPPQYS